MPRWLWIAIIVLVLALFWAALPTDDTGSTDRSLSGGAPPRCLPPDPVGPGEPPRQSRVPAAMQGFRRGDFTITPVAGFSLQARVLAREDYSFGTEAELSPTDLALGWGRMAEPTTYQALEISQSGRWYHYRWGSEGPPLPEGEIARSSANMHIIPMDAAVAEALQRVRQDQTIRLDGWLVEVQRDDGWQWRSSLTRDDTGGGACELILVCSIQVP